MFYQQCFIKRVLFLLCIGMIAISGCRKIPASTPTTQAPTTESSRTAQPNPTDGPPQPIPTNTPEGTKKPTGADAELLKGIGVMGDSFYDEYRANDYRGGEYSKVTFNLVELLANLRGFNFGPWGEWDGPRRSGYEYNFARSGATSTTMVDSEQHIGLAELVRQGKVTFVFIGIGANDFSPYSGQDYEQIYANTMTDEQLQNKIDRAVGDVTEAVDTILAADPRGMAITLFTQWEMDPTLSEKYPNDAGRKRVADAINEVNDSLRAMADERSVLVVDQNSLGMKILSQLEENRYLDFDGEKVDFMTHGDEPHHSRLADGQHIGTLMSGYSANEYFINPLNEFFGTHILPLSDQEILEAAGIQ